MGAFMQSFALGSAALFCGLSGCNNDTAVIGTVLDAGSDAAHTGDGAITGDSAVPGDGSSASDALPDTDALPAALPVAGLRVANWSPDAPAVDICIAPHGTAAFGSPLFSGPLTGASDASAAADGGIRGLNFPNVSSYVYIAPATYDIRVVVAGAPDCSTPLTSDLTAFPPLALGTFGTVALLGALHPLGTTSGLRVVGYSDDQKPSSGVGIRLIHAAPSAGSIDFGLGTASVGWKTLFAGVAFGRVGSPPDAGAADAAALFDSNGYLATKAIVAGTLSAHAAGATTDTAVATNVSAAAGSLLTFVLVESGTQAIDAGSLRGTFHLLSCVDNAGIVGPLGDCSVTSN